MNKLASVEIPRNAGDFRLIDRRVIEELRKLTEQHGFFRGLVPFVGFRQGSVTFDRDARHSGKTKYNYYIGSITNGINALVCFSNRLLTLASIIGFVLFFASVVLSIAVAYVKLCTTIQIASGIASVMILVLFTSGVQALLIGILGSYIGRIYDETKRRPLYIVDRKVGLTEEDTQARTKGILPRMPSYPARPPSPFCRSRRQAHITREPCGQSARPADPFLETRRHRRVLPAQVGGAPSPFARRNPPWRPGDLPPGEGSVDAGFFRAHVGAAPSRHGAKEA